MDAATELTWTYLQRPPQPDPPRQPAGTQLLTLLLRLPASGRHYRRCRVQPCKTNPTLRQRRLCIRPPRTTILRFARAGAHPYSC
ncbi:hypothetical protein D7Y48_20470 [Stenotrophomonas maltophilia]|nr:hypothetical protein [Stenotrophomonas maltophilia]MBA0293419.1 hypothetical protein [Stenotrophomonas maltophilia]MBA0419054.1 hypothetical protein [Stenotrophomonas maltophilia]